MWPNTQFPVDLVTFTEEILTGKLYLLCSVCQPKKGESLAQKQLLNSTKLLIE